MKKHVYLESVFLLERLQRMFLEVLKNELGQHKIDDLNNVQAIILYNIGDTEITVSAITNRGYYLGSNASYNLKKMLKNGYIEQKQSSIDRRSSHIKLSTKGVKVKEKLDIFFQTQTESLSAQSIGEEGLKNFVKNGKLIEAFLSEELFRKVSLFSV